MTSRFWFALSSVFFLLAPAAALADGVPLDDTAFTAYIQQKLQLYSAAPVRVTAPFSVAIGPATGANLVYTFKPLHDDCAKDPASCPTKVHDYVQDIVRRFPGANTDPAPSQLLPSDKPAFMAYLAAELGRLVPAARVEADGLALNVTRPGGHAIPFDQAGYFKLCADANFECRTGMIQALERDAAWLTVPEPSGLRASLHFMPGCSVIASSTNNVFCTITPSHEPMAAFFRAAFSNLEEVCFKTGPGGGSLPLTNADRKDMDLSISQILDICEKSTHDALGPFAQTPPAADGIASVGGPYAASRVLFPADWTGLAQESGGHLLVAMPTRDTLLYSEGDSEAQIAALGARAYDAYHASALGLSSDVYRWNGSGWTLATDTSTMNTGPANNIDLMPRLH